MTDVFNHLFILNQDDKWNLFGQSSEKYEKPKGEFGKFAKEKKVYYPQIDFTIITRIELFILTYLPFLAPCITNGKKKAKLFKIDVVKGSFNGGEIPVKG